jgi:lipopolysaccharide/colanic/teichoic acid biosynthesis glycosyltransferase
MAVVGPRPEGPEFGADFRQLLPFYALRLTLRPGITGWAQVWHVYSSTLEDTRTKLQYDLYYVKNASFLLDCSILLHTLRIVLLGKGR